MAAYLAFIALIMASVGCLYLVCAAVVSARFGGKAISEPIPLPSVSILKPLKGDEPDLLRNLASFCTQAYPAPVQQLPPPFSSNGRNHPPPPDLAAEKALAF